VSSAEVGWQVTLCDPIMACEFPVAVKMLNCYTPFTLLYFNNDVDRIYEHRPKPLCPSRLNEKCVAKPSV